MCCVASSGGGATVVVAFSLAPMCRFSNSSGPTARFGDLWPLPVRRTPKPDVSSFGLLRQSYFFRCGDEVYQALNGPWWFSTAVSGLVMCSTALKSVV